MAELLAPFRGTGTLIPSMLVRAGLPLALAGLDLGEGGTVIDLDDPVVLQGEGLRPSQLATRRRSMTQIHAAYVDAVAMRWWSTLESRWINWTLFEQAAPALELAEIAQLDGHETEEFGRFENKWAHYRDRRGHEVDLVIEHAGGDVVAIEVKASATPRLRDISGLSRLRRPTRRAFSPRPPPAPRSRHDPDGGSHLGYSACGFVERLACRLVKTETHRRGAL